MVRFMNIHLYAKTHEPLSLFDDALNIIRQDGDDVQITSENKRTFRGLNDIKTVRDDIIYIVTSLSSLGLNDAEIATQLTWFSGHAVKLVICDIPSTYEYGVTQPMNQAILSTIIQSVLNENSNIVTVSLKKAHCGRNKLPFPDNWDELYKSWSDGEITSKEFIARSGLKKATFYNLVTEYKSIQEYNDQYLKKYRTV